MDITILFTIFGIAHAIVSCKDTHNKRNEQVKWNYFFKINFLCYERIRFR